MTCVRHSWDTSAATFLVMEANIKQNSPLWLDDGNVVLTAASIAFKVHRGILERHSTTFKSAISNPSQGKDHLIDDSCLQGLV